MPAAIVTGDANGNTGESRLRPGGGRGVGDSRTDAGAWKSIALGIVLAGGVYPLVLVAIWTVVFGIIVVRLWLIDPAHMSTLEDLITLVGVAVMYAGFGSMCGLIWTALVTAVTLPFANLFAWSMTLRCGVVGWGAFCGGLVGFTAILPFMFSIHWQADFTEFWQVVLILVLGPGLATVMGQLGGAWGGWRVGAYDRAIARAAVEAPYDGPEPSATTLDKGEVATPHAGFQFRIRHLLWIAVWLSLLLTVMRLSGIPYAFVVPLVVGWFAFQVATLWLGRALAHRFGRWRQRRQIRST
jgi:hypothetical protein